MTELPSDWESKTMGEIGRYLNGKAFKSQDWKSTGRPIIRIQNLTGSGDDFNYFQGDIEDRYVVMPGDLLFSWSATLGTYIWKGPEAVLNQHIFKVESFIDSKFHRYLLDFKIQEMISKTHGSGMVHITKKSFEAIEVGIPPLPEQQKIVEILEDHLSRLDTAMADVKRAKEKAAQFRRSLLQAIFEGQYSTNSEKWVRRTIGDFAEVKGGKRLPKGTQWSDVPTLHPYIRATDIKNGKIKSENLVHVPDSVWNSISRYVVEVNDVVITIAGTIGEIAVVPSELEGANLTENAAKIVFDHNIVMPAYLSMFLQSPNVQRELKELSRATTQAKLALYRIETVKVPVPTLNEQRELMELVDIKLSLLSSSLSQISTIEMQATSLRRSLLQAAFTGQLTKEVASV